MGQPESFSPLRQPRLLREQMSADSAHADLPSVSPGTQGWDQNHPGAMNPAHPFASISFSYQLISQEDLSPGVTLPWNFRSWAFLGLFRQSLLSFCSSLCPSSSVRPGTKAPAFRICWIAWYKDQTCIVFYWASLQNAWLVFKPRSMEVGKNERRK